MHVIFHIIIVILRFAFRLIADLLKEAVVAALFRWILKVVGKRL